MSQTFEFTTLQTTSDRPIHDPLHCIPIQPQQITNLGQTAAGQNHIQRKPLE
jgi:hypothetical protein